MEDYLKRYEDEDEKGVSGLIIFFIVTLILFEPLYGLISMFQTRPAFDAMPLAGNIYISVLVSHFLFIIFTVFSFYKLPRYAVKVAKSFLIFRFVFLTLSIMINFNHTFHDHNAIGVRTYQFYSMTDMVVKIILIPEAYVFIFSIAWFIFMVKSKAIKKNFGISFENV